jgi:hypothetical protein
MTATIASPPMNVFIYAAPQEWDRFATGYPERLRIVKPELRCDRSRMC